MARRRTLPPTLLVTVTDEDIIIGEKWAPTRCPVVRAIQRDYPWLKRVFVSDKYIAVTDSDGCRYKWDTPDMVVDFVRNYDRDEVLSELNGERAASAGPKRRRASSSRPPVGPPSVSLSRDAAFDVRPPRDTPVLERRKRDVENDNRKWKLNKETAAQRRKREEQRREQRDQTRRGIPTTKQHRHEAVQV